MLREEILDILYAMHLETKNDYKCTKGGVYFIDNIERNVIRVRPQVVNFLAPVDA